MKNKHLFWIIPLILIVGIVLGLLLTDFAEQKMLGKYDLYNCIYNNADANGFNQNPIAIQEIQDQCICFRENNYTNVFEACKEKSA